MPGADNRNPRNVLIHKRGAILKHRVRTAYMTQVTATVSQSFLNDHAPAFRHWVSGFTLQTLVYGINIVLFLMSLWVLAIHILKGVPSNRFHRHHLFQNSILLVYVTGMFALSSVYMAYQGIMADDMWFRFLDMNGNTSDTIKHFFEDRISMQRTCNAILILVNWGTVGLLLWRCLLHYKVRSVFPCQVISLPYLLFASDIATGLLRIIYESMSTSHPARSRKWSLIHWSIASALYYLLSLLIVARVVYHRRIIGRDFGESEVRHFTSYLTIFYESGVIVLAFSTAYLVVLARFPDLMYILQSTMVQIQVMLSMIIVQRVAVGKAWSGKTIDCILHSESRHESRHEEVSTMGFNPNTQLSCTQNDYTSEISSDTKARHDLTMEMQEVIRSKV